MFVGSPDTSGIGSAAALGLYAGAALVFVIFMFIEYFHRVELANYFERVKESEREKAELVAEAKDKGKTKIYSSVYVGPKPKRMSIRAAVITAVLIPGLVMLITATIANIATHTNYRHEVAVQLQKHYNISSTYLTAGDVYEAFASGETYTAVGEKLSGSVVGKGILMPTAEGDRVIRRYLVLGWDEQERKMTLYESRSGAESLKEYVR